MQAKNTEIASQIHKELGELTSSISKMMEVFRQIRQPIQESSEKVPSTTKQLERVTQQTEQATHKVLDIVEAITNRESEIGESIAKIREMVPDEVWRSDLALNSLYEIIRNNSDSNLNDTMVIMEALQFQDITSQQIEHAVSQLEDVETKLQTLLVTTGMSKENSRQENGKKARAYDPNANYMVDNHNQQEEVDQLISNMNTKKP